MSTAPVRDPRYITPFGRWLHVQKEIDATECHINIQNVDYVFHREAADGTIHMMFVEEKQYAKSPYRPQQRMISFVEQIISSANGKVFNVYGQSHKLAFHGYHVLQFERTTPNDGKAYWDGAAISPPDLAFCLQLRKFVPPGSGCDPVVLSTSDIDTTYATPFGRWLRAERSIDWRHGAPYIHDVGYIIHHWRPFYHAVWKNDEPLAILEEHRFMRPFDPIKLKLAEFIDQIMRYARSEEIVDERRSFNFFYGRTLDLEFERESPDDGRMWLNGTLIDADELLDWLSFNRYRDYVDNERRFVEAHRMDRSTL